MKKLVYILLLCPMLIFSQDWGRYMKSNDNKNGLIYGSIIDRETKEKLQFASVILFNNKDELVEGMITDEKGKFNFKELAIGDYKIEIEYIGYVDTLFEVKISDKAPIINLKNILIKKTNTELLEVILSEEKPIYETKLEKIIYNAENDLNEGLDDATDVLRKTPLISVDIEGNVSLRGSRNIKFLINGRSSSFFSSNSSDALKMIPAEQIKSIEVITSPTAKYDGEGEAGIINIVTQEKNIEGFKSTINGSFGTRVNNSRLSFDYGKGKFGLSSRGHARYGWPRETRSSFTRSDSLEQTTTTQTSTGQGNWVGFGGGIEAYYAFNGYNSLVSSFDFYGSLETNKDSATDKLYYSLETLNNPDSIYNSYLIEDHFDYSYEYAIDYIKKFPGNDNKEFRIAYQFGKEVHDDLNDLYYNINADSLKNKNDGNANEHTIQLDYSIPIFKKQSLDIGAKYINRDIYTRYKTDGSISVKPEEVFLYNQQVYAAYISGNFELKKGYSIVSGLRLENTIVEGSIEESEPKLIANEEILPGKELIYVSDSTNFKKDPYLHYLPSFILTKQLKMGKSLKLSYTKRIQRPSMHYINPNIVISDNFAQEIGNPYLDPSKTHQIELGYNSFGKKYKGNYYIYFKRQLDLVESIIELDTTQDITISITNYKNIRDNNSIGFNYFGSISLGKLNFRLGFNIYTYQTTTNHLGEILYNWHMGGSYDVGKGFMVEAFSFHRSPSRTIQGSTANFSMMSFGIKKEFPNKKGSIGFRCFEPFNKWKSFESELSDDTFYQNSNYEILFRSFGLSFKYTFGEVNFNAIKDKSKISNEDSLEEDGNEF